MQQQNNFTFEKIAKTIFTIGIILGLFFIVKKLSSVLIPFALAVFFAYMINPLVKFLQCKIKLKNRVLSVITALILIITSITLLFNWLIPQFSSEMIKMTQLTKLYINQANYKDLLPGNSEIWIKDFLSHSDFQKLLSTESFSNIFQKIMSQSWTIFSSSVSLIMSLLGLFIIIIYLIFILIDYERISHGWIDLLPPKNKSLIISIVEDLKDGMNKYFRAQGLIALIVGILLAIGFKIIGLPMAIIIGLFIGALNIVPYLQLAGIPFALILALLKAMENGTNFWQEALLVIIVMAVVQLIQEIILTPKILGKVYGMHPAIILLSLSIWGSLLGLVGMLIALPVTTLLMSYYNKYIILSEETESTTEETK